MSRSWPTAVVAAGQLRFFAVRDELAGQFGPLPQAPATGLRCAELTAQDHGAGRAGAPQKIAAPSPA